jgi:hypothetical protein
MQSTALGQKLDTERQNTNVSFLGFGINMKIFCCVGVVCVYVARQLFFVALRKRDGCYVIAMGGMCVLQGGAVQTEMAVVGCVRRRVCRNVSIGKWIVKGGNKKK